MLRVNDKGLKIMVDDEFVGDLPEGQDMIVEFADADVSTKREPSSGQITPSLTPQRFPTGRLEMKLIF